jgi:demethylmenaquinone methyltransferase/2-methoxy-6-polyprenyl-1,4-benzoquinol methylase
MEIGSIMDDPYRKSARIYDRIFDGMNKGLKLVGIRMFRPTKGMNILDVGCGTGTHLELYQRYQCNLSGLDLSQSMLQVASHRLKSTAQLALGDATSMPYEDARFDLVIAMLALHEMSPKIRPQVLCEIKRVLKKDGRILLIDFHNGPYQPFQGWVSKGIIIIAELAAGRNHFINYRNFMNEGGLDRLINQQSLQIEKQQVLGGGTFGIYLVR